MPDIPDGQTVEMQGSGSKPYLLKNVGGVYSCSCPAWRNQSVAIETRTCKHLRKYRGEAAEEARLGAALPTKPQKPEGAEEGEALTLLLAESWDGELDPTGWWMSEKLDGVRAYWDGKQFLSRQNNIFHAPDWFTVGLPPMPLDGELWIGRKAFQRTVSVVRRQDKADVWKEVKYLVFDAPQARGGFEKRVEWLGEVVPKWGNKYLQLHQHTACEGVDSLLAELKRVEGLGGEGLMLRKPGSKYELGRSSTLLKVKTFYDAEGLVVGHEAGKGRHKGRLGALVVELPNGVRFSVGTGFSDKQREAPPPVGATITFRYQELTEAGVPRFPIFAGERIDAASQIVPLVKAPPPAVKAVSPSSPGVRYFECVEGGSNKFWEVGVSGNDLTTRWGKIGSAGQTKTKTYATADKARAEADKLIAEKTGGGYEEK
jgi:DNA ligase-1